MARDLSEINQLCFRLTDGRGNGFFKHDRELNKALRRRGWVAGNICDPSPMETEAARMFCDARYTEAFMSPPVTFDDPSYNELGTIMCLSYHMWFANESVADELEAILQEFSRPHAFMLSQPLSDKSIAYLDDRKINWLVTSGPDGTMISMGGGDEDVVWVKMAG